MFCKQCILHHSEMQKRLRCHCSPVSPSLLTGRTESKVTLKQTLIDKHRGANRNASDHFQTLKTLDFSVCLWTLFSDIQYINETIQRVFNPRYFCCLFFLTLAPISLHLKYDTAVSKIAVTLVYSDTRHSVAKISDEHTADRAEARPDAAH